MRRWHLLAVAGALAAASLSPLAPVAVADLSREPGAVYLEDLFERPITLKVAKPAPIFYQLSGDRRLGTLVADQKVELVAISDRAYRVRGRATHGDVSGWVGPTFFEKPSDDFDEKIKKLYERQQIVNELIANHEVALGMTPPEVVASLGEPDERSAELDATTTKEAFSFLTYQRVPQIATRRDIYGRLYNTTIYVKVETGRRTVHFTNGVVTSLTETEKTPSRGGLRIVTPPINLW